MFCLLKCIIKMLNIPAYAMLERNYVRVFEDKIVDIHMYTNT